MMTRNDWKLAEAIVGRGHYSPAMRREARDEWLRRRPERPRRSLVREWAWAADGVARGQATTRLGEALEMPRAHEGLYEDGTRWKLEPVSPEGERS